MKKINKNNILKFALALTLLIAFVAIFGYMFATGDNQNVAEATGRYDEKWTVDSINGYIEYSGIFRDAPVGTFKFMAWIQGANKFERAISVNYNPTDFSSTVTKVEGQKLAFGNEYTEAYIQRLTTEESNKYDTSDQCYKLYFKLPLNLSSLIYDFGMYFIPKNQVSYTTPVSPGTLQGWPTYDINDKELDKGLDFTSPVVEERNTTSSTINYAYTDSTHSVEYTINSSTTSEQKNEYKNNISNYIVGEDTLAIINGKRYTSLSSAFLNIGNNYELKLLKDVDMNGATLLFSNKVSKAKINLNGYKILNAVIDAAYAENSGESPILSELSIYSDKDGAAIDCSKTNNLSCIKIGYLCKTLYINNVTLISNTSAISMNFLLKNISSGKAQIDIYNCDIQILKAGEQTVKNDAIQIKSEINGNVNIISTSITSKDYCISTDNYDFFIKLDEWNANTYKPSYYSWGNDRAFINYTGSIDSSLNLYMLNIHVLAGRFSSTEFVYRNINGGNYNKSIDAQLTRIKAKTNGKYSNLAFLNTSSDKNSLMYDEKASAYPYRVDQCYMFDLRNGEGIKYIPQEYKNKSNSFISNLLNNTNNRESARGDGTTFAFDCWSKEMDSNSSSDKVTKSGTNYALSDFNCSYSTKPSTIKELIYYAVWHSKLNTSVIVQTRPLSFSQYGLYAGSTKVGSGEGYTDKIEFNNLLVDILDVEGEVDSEVCAVTLNSPLAFIIFKDQSKDGFNYIAIKDKTGKHKVCGLYSSYKIEFYYQGADKNHYYQFNVYASSEKEATGIKAIERFDSQGSININCASKGKITNISTNGMCTLGYNSNQSKSYSYSKYTFTNDVMNSTPVINYVDADSLIFEDKTIFEGNVINQKSGTTINPLFNIKSKDSTYRIAFRNSDTYIFNASISKNEIIYTRTSKDSSKEINITDKNGTKQNEFYHINTNVPMIFDSYNSYLNAKAKESDEYTAIRALSASSYTNQPYIQLLSDYRIEYLFCISGLKADFTIDLNGHTLYIPISFNVSSFNLTIKNGTIISSCKESVPVFEGDAGGSILLYACNLQTTLSSGLISNLVDSDAKLTIDQSLNDSNKYAINITEAAILQFNSNKERVVKSNVYIYSGKYTFNLYDSTTYNYVVQYNADGTESKPLSDGNYKCYIVRRRDFEYNGNIYGSLNQVINQINNDINDNLISSSSVTIKLIDNVTLFKDTIVKLNNKKSGDVVTLIIDCHSSTTAYTFDFNGFQIYTLSPITIKGYNTKNKTVFSTIKGTNKLINNQSIYKVSLQGLNIIQYESTTNALYGSEEKARFELLGCHIEIASAVSIASSSIGSELDKDKYNPIVIDKLVVDGNTGLSYYFGNFNSLSSQNNIYVDNTYFNTDPSNFIKLSDGVNKKSVNINTDVTIEGKTKTVNFKYLYESDIVIQIADRTYTSIVKAMNGYYVEGVFYKGYQDGETLKLLVDVVVNQKYYLDVLKISNFIIDLNFHNFNYNENYLQSIKNITIMNGTINGTSFFKFAGKEQNLTLSHITLHQNENASSTATVFDLANMEESGKLTITFKGNNKIIVKSGLLTNSDSNEINFKFIDSYTYFYVNKFGSNIAISEISNISRIYYSNNMYGVINDENVNNFRYVCLTSEESNVLGINDGIALTNVYKYNDCILMDPSNYDISWYDNSKDRFTLNNASQLIGFAAITNGYTSIKDETFENKEIILGNDINIGGYSWVPIENFEGNFNGNNHTISNLYLNEIDLSYESFGLFADFGGTYIKNLNLTGKIDLDSLVNIDEEETALDIGSLVGSSSGAIIDCSSSVDITIKLPYAYCSYIVGGLVGESGYGIYNSSYLGTIKIQDYQDPQNTKYYIGKLCGYSKEKSQIVNTFASNNTYKIKSSGNEILETELVGIKEDTLIYNSYCHINATSINYYIDSLGTSTYKIAGSYSISDVYNDLRRELDQFVIDNKYKFEKDNTFYLKFDMNYWMFNDGEIGYPTFYLGAYFRLEENDRDHKTCDIGFSLNPTKQGYIFKGWTPVYDDPSQQTTNYQNKVIYYAIFSEENEILNFKVYSWTYNETPITPTAEAHRGTVQLEYALDDVNVIDKSKLDYTSMLPVNAGKYYVRAFVSRTNKYEPAEEFKTFEIYKAKYNLNGVLFENKTVVYNGKDQYIVLSGSLLPAGVSANYSKNKGKNAGVYDATCGFIYNENYELIQNNKVITELKAKLTIEKANYDMSLYQFEDTYYCFDGTEHTLELTYPLDKNGTPISLPTGVYKTYSKNNSQSAVGKYKVTVSFTLDEANKSNYNDIPSKEAYLIIDDKNVIDMSGYVFKCGEFDYDGESHSVEVENLSGSGISVEYISNSSKYPTNSMTNVGEIIVTAKFTYVGITGETVEVLTDTTNGYDYYKVSDGVTTKFYYMIPNKVAKLTINKISYNTSGIKFENKTVTYDGSTHSIVMTGLPEGLTVTYVSNNPKYPTNSMDKAGTIIITPIFSGDFENYEEVEWPAATLTINKAVYDMSKVKFDSPAPIVYDGKAHSLSISGELPEGVTVSYSVQSITDAQSMTVYAFFSGDFENYEQISPMSAVLKIVKASYETQMESVLFTDATYEYDGSVRTLTISGELPEGVTVSYTLNAMSKVGKLDVTASFTGDYRNYYEIPSRTRTLTINKATIDVSGLKFNSKEFIYDGTIKELAVSGLDTLPENVKVVYINNRLLNVGSTTVIAQFKVDERCYNAISPLTAVLKVNPAKYDLSNIKFNSIDLVYDGKPHEVKIEGKLPYGVSVKYFNNIQLNVGKYTASAVFDAIDYKNYEVIESMSCTINIAKATYDMSKVKFNSLELAYDKQTHKLVIEGELPDGVIVKYTENELTNVGELKVTATFSGDYDNYYVIPSKEATLKIIKATYDMSSIKFESKSYLYDGEEKELLISGTLPEGVLIEYTGNKRQKSGESNAVVKFIVLDNENYNEIEDMTAVLTINKLDYDMSKVKFEDAEYVYDGKEHKLEISGVMPEGVRVQYSFNKITDVGEIEVKAAFQGDTINHNPMPQMKATLRILMANYDLSSIKLDSKTILYDGKSHSLAIEGTLPNGVSIKYSGNDKVEPGVYQVTALIAGDTKNYYTKTLEATLTIINTIIHTDDKYTETQLKIEALEGFSKDVSVSGGYSVEKNNSYSNLVTKTEKVVGVFSVSLYTVDANGNKVEYQPADVSRNGKITLKMLLPQGIDLEYIAKIYHVHNGEAKEIEFSRQRDSQGYFTIEVYNLSDFVFIENNNNYVIHQIGVLVSLIIAGIIVLYLISLIFYFIWKKTGKTPLKFMIPIFRFRNKLFFKIKWNDAEIRDQSFVGVSKEEKKDKKAAKKAEKKDKSKDKKEKNK